LERCFASLLLPRRAGGQSAAHGLKGAAVASPATPLHAAPGLHLYGSEATQVNACPGQSNALGVGLTEAMVRYAARFEHAQTVEDVLARRSRILFLDAAEAARLAPAVADILGQELGTDPALGAFLDLCTRYLPASAAT
jgi:glycerol-3-phosphate dehydrogenase